MLGILQAPQIEALLKSQIVGRIGCHVDGETYIVPISYAYDGTYIYCHAIEGKKVQMMRVNPRICFEVDEMKDMGNWESVVVQGVYQELREKELRDLAMDHLLNRYLPIISSVTTHLGEHWPFHPTDTREIKGIVFRIKLTKKTGRYENREVIPY